MKINAKALAPLALVAAFGLGTVTPHAQTTPQKIGFVDVQRLVTQNAGMKDVQAVQKQASTELDGLANQIKAIDAKGTAVTAAEKDRRTQLVSTYQAKAKTYDTQLQGLQPKVTAAEKAADAAINTVAKANGFGIVMDRAVAAQGLVVYADNGTDITEAALKALK